MRIGLVHGQDERLLQTVKRSVEQMKQLYKQGADAVRIGDYVRRWRQWVRSGLDGYGPREKPSPP
jgi:aryl carrier-like protein